MAFTEPVGENIAEMEIKRSRFIARVAHAADEAAARAIIDEERSTHPKARHHCSAFVLGPDSRTQRFSDDGEPAGTAGAPILEVLTGHRLTNVVAVVTRYFGGTLLGAGGLVRAYGNATSEAVAGLRTVDRHLVVPVSVELDYAQAAQAQRAAEQSGWRMLDSQYGAAVVHTFGVPEAEVEACLSMIADVSAGAAEPAVAAPDYR
ncbi:YigZ family protein [Brevibacterium daeguense]|uniref:YigZ family protein n=1 Tax=Brevibacterium daeguense TaxID=909936 RepID=A0ABP8EGT9_9MICO|nr:YigZ family protein [Brevibacterium daeguense]